MTLAALYARRSNEQNGLAEEAKSVTRQLENARAFAASKGWTVVAEFKDDAVSGAEFERRDEFQRMLKAAERREFQYLIVAEQKAIGREMIETASTLKRLYEHGVEVWAYLESGKRLTPKTHMDKVLTSIQGFADEDHLVKTSERMREAMVAKVRAGFWVGGRVFGYRLVNIESGHDKDGRPLRVGTKLEVNETEARWVRRMFELYASGLGLRSVTRQLNLEGGPRPAPYDYRKRVPSRGWSPGTVRARLRDELYRGVHVYGRSRKREPVFHKVTPQDVPETEWIRIDRPDLRIVSEELWQQVATRLAAGKDRWSSNAGRPRRGSERNLLSGLARCGACGGGMVVERRKEGPEYCCFRYRHAPTKKQLKRWLKDHPGATPNPNAFVCTNSLRVPVSIADEAVLLAIEEHVTAENAAEFALALQDEAEQRQDEKESLEAELKQTESKLRRLIDAFGDGDDDVRDQIEELRNRKKELRAALESVEPPPPVPRAAVESIFWSWREQLRSSTEQARAILQRVLDGRITFTPDPEERCYRFEAPTRFDRLLSVETVPRDLWGYRTTKPHEGLEHLTPDDLAQGEELHEIAPFARWLEQAYESHGKSMVALRGFEPRFDG